MSWTRSGARISRRSIWRSSAHMAEDLQARMQRILDAFVAKGIVGASAAVAAAGSAPVTAVAGLADRGRGIPVGPSHLFKNGSCTQTFVTATLMRLAPAGPVRLPAPAARRVSGPA